MSDLVYPENLQYTTDHEWVSITDGVARVGITSFAQDALGDIVYVSVPNIGDEVEVDGAAAEVESTKSVSDVNSPVGGEVTAVNEKLDESPELLNSDPYGEGWIFEVKLASADATADLLDAAAYKEMLD
ncbi:glycine cleavage system protein GcvH [Dermatophilus congolensis]|uniref:Glycine cleavage system H protein n=1 Tax=Dermatophilus congolensis TaxID=1863 RepID=A0A239VMF8_9MICO|nr:glycine cleavage system protein GcvH [Dermatophilus congolensis]MBO3129383.1 glycine cleavage system protein GcvH [Dermatophilus congolensis]MBO3131984.1 glycine cleavage system protein GcvH [Dermatophilus congolensis]MBO3133860.1 glycine cleavage system protein GcvH [Dermatophilus congolensis]MBO3136090.1 glycine cleavage system protein GcvH [Dermatophilus congolensis]MBO3138334.1 glycine cleavage system protein GcvH [Dermatophilus congolensis]